MVEKALIILPHPPANSLGLNDEFAGKAMVWTPPPLNGI